MKVFFDNSSGDKLCGILSDPNRTQGDLIVILCHGFSTGKDGRTYVRLQDILNRHGIATLRFDFFGHGESEGRFEAITVSEAVDDVLSAAKYVREAGYTRIGLVGSSFGGIASILAASQVKELQFLALKSPVSDYLSKLIADRDRQDLDSWRKQGFIHITDPKGNNLKLNYSFFQDAGMARGYDVAAQIKVPTLIVHGDVDESVPIQQSQRLVELLVNGRLEVITGADHQYSRPDDFEQMLSLISSFVIRQANS